MSWPDVNLTWSAVSLGPLAVPVLALLPYVLLTLALLGMLAMYLALKREIAAQAKRNRRMEAMLLRLREATPAGAHSAGFEGSDAAPGDPSNSPVNGSADSWADGPGHTQAARSEGADVDTRVWGPAAVRPGMNLSRRVQALRLLRRGEDLGHIASALGVPRCEVALLVRVQRLSMAAASAARASPLAQISGRSSAGSQRSDLT